jgi:hypothetical protein
MLEKLVEEIRAGGTVEIRELAIRLGTTPQLVEVMLEHLQRSGLIQAYVNCSDGCLGCSLKNSCGKPAAGTVRLWQMTGER